MTDEILTDGRGRTYKVVRHYRKREGKLVYVGQTHTRVGETKKLGRRKRLRQERETQVNEQS